MDYRYNNEICLRPSEIRFTQDSIHNRFQDCGRVNDLIAEIESGDTEINAIPIIRVSKKDNKYYSIDNRRLYVFRVLEQRNVLNQIKVKVVPYILEKKFTTENDGVSIRVRRDRTFDHTAKIRHKHVHQPARVTIAAPSRDTVVPNVAAALPTERYISTLRASRVARQSVDTHQPSVHKSLGSASTSGRTNDSIYAPTRKPLQTITPNTDRPDEKAYWPNNMRQSMHNPAHSNRQSAINQPNPTTAQRITRENVRNEEWTGAQDDSESTSCWSCCKLM